MTLQKLLFVLSMGLATYGQTRVNLGSQVNSQAQNIDFTAAAATLPVKLGSALPASCQPGELFFKSNATAGSNLYGCTGTNTWTAQGGGGGVVQDITSLNVAYVGAQTLSIGTGCTLQKPCNVRFGNTVYSFQNTATVTLSGASSGQAFIYVSSSGLLTVGHNLTVSCSGCSTQAGITSFPTDSLPLYRWTATTGSWDTTGGADFRAFLSGANVVGGTGLVGTNSGGTTTVAIDTAVVPLRVSVPPTSSTSCTAGTWALSSTFFYVCVATNAWVRASVASF